MLMSCERAVTPRGVGGQTWERLGRARRARGTRARAADGSSDFEFDPSSLPTFGKKAGSSVGGGRTGGGLVLPGMDGFDDSVVRTNPLSGTSPAIRRPSGEDEVRGPAGVIPKVGGELQGAFEPFKPPETYETAKLTADEDDPDRMLMMMRQRAGLWHRLAKFIRPLNAKGFQPNDIFDATGIEPKEQAIWVTWLQCYASLKEGVKFPSEKLEYFNDEFRGAPNLSQIMYLPAAVRAEAAEFIVDNEFEELQSKELVKAYEIKRAGAQTVAARDFNSTPGDILAYKLYRDILELQRYQGEEEAEKIYKRAMKFAKTETAKTRLASAVQMFAMSVTAGPAAANASRVADEDIKAEVQVVRLEEAEVAFRPLPVVGNLSKVTSAKIRTAGTIERDGNIFGVFTPQSNTDWVALPQWELLSTSTAPFALFVDDTSKTDINGLKEKAEPGLLIADKGESTPRLGYYYLVSKKSSLVLAGSNSAAETVSVMDGREILTLERNGKSVTTLARVLLCVRAPSRGGGDGMTTEFVA